ncbi:MAG: CDP-alcohol phosphatidyltransferase family protein [Candidatus Krumholzibacteria bacterium]|nr:CDP-alcohol phosphatidyltransferase family protein [Candidatus Krumholzibacteria bacterium]
MKFIILPNVGYCTGRFRERGYEVAGKSEIRDRLRGLLDPVVALCSYMGISPMGVTLFGIFFSFIGAIYVANGKLFAGGIILIISGLADTIDGSLARSQGKVTTFGAFIDSVGDRVSEMAYFTGLVFYFMRYGQSDFTRYGQGNGTLVFFVLAALAGSFLTSYTRARAEGLGLECTVGVLERPERVALMIVGLIFGRVVLTAVIVFLAAMSIFTFLQRVQHIRKITTEKVGDSDSVL